MEKSEEFLGLSELLRLWPNLADRHKAALKEGWGVAEEFMRLHLEAVSRISKTAGKQPDASVRMVIGLGCHAFNLYMSTLNLAIRGIFDVAAHLARGMFDCVALIQVVAADKGQADNFETGSLKPAEARKLMVRVLRDAGQSDLADDFEYDLIDEKHVVDDLAHVRALHLSYTQERDSRSVKPHALGRFDVDLCKAQWQATLVTELRILNALRTANLGADWIERFNKAESQLKGWSKGQ